MEESKRLRLKLTTATEVRRALTRVSNMVLNGEEDGRVGGIACRVETYQKRTIRKKNLVK